MPAQAYCLQRPRGRRRARQSLSRGRSQPSSRQAGKCPISTAGALAENSHQAKMWINLCLHLGMPCVIAAFVQMAALLHRVLQL